jgi:diadenosine tetraphosphate (Ap4A) HIT family hydrolase
VRINYECLGNQVAHVHWHVIPRHASDPDPRNAVWGWSPPALRGAMSDTDRLELALALRLRLAGP